MPTARHPLILAICPTTEPTAPDAAATTTVSPAFGWPISRRPDIGRHARHAEHAERSRDRRRRRIELAQAGAVRQRIVLPAAIARARCRRPRISDCATRRPRRPCRPPSSRRPRPAWRRISPRSCGRACRDRARARACASAPRRRRAPAPAACDEREVVEARRASGRLLSRIWRLMRAAIEVLLATIKPHPEERAPKSGLPDFGTSWCRDRQQPISMHGVSKDHHTCCGMWPSFETPASQAPQDEVQKEFFPAVTPSPRRRRGGLRRPSARSPISRRPQALRAAGSPGAPCPAWKAPRRIAGRRRSRATRR